MKINEIVSRWVPASIAYKVIAYKKLFSPYSLRKEKLKLSNLKKSKAGGRCFIVGTGPSLADVSLSRLRDYDLFLTGESYLHKDAQKLSNLYYIAGSNHPPFEREYIRELALRINKLPASTKYIFSHTGYKYSFSKFFFGDEALLRDREKYIINYTGSSDLTKNNRHDRMMYDIQRSPFNPRTSIFTALQVAYFMGYTKIYLIGCEHDYLTRYLDGGFADHHFYHDKDSSTDMVQGYLDDFTLYDWFEEYYKRWRSYIYMNEHYRSTGVEVINCTPGGILDVFPRKSLSAVLAK